MLGKAEEAERKAHASVHPAAAAITLRKGLGALRWSECLEFSECGGGGGVSWNRNKTFTSELPEALPNPPHSFAIRRSTESCHMSSTGSDHPDTSSLSPLP